MRNQDLPSTIPRPLTVYYDGACVVCAREVQHYARRSSHLRLVDISADDFDSERHGRSHAEFMARMHARDAQGRWYVGIDAFQAIWRVIPGRRYDLMAALLDWPIIRPVAAGGYRLFARYRHWLPRRKGGCTGNSCRWPKV